MKDFRWQQWLVLALFLIVAGFATFKAVQTVRRVGYWHAHRDEEIRGWMNVGYVAHSYRVPPHVLYQALGLPQRPPDKRPLRQIAKAQNRSMDEIRAVLGKAIVHARASNPPPAPPSPDRGTPP